MIHDFEGLRKKLEECIELNGLNSEQTRKISEKYNELVNSYYKNEKQYSKDNVIYIKYKESINYLRKFTKDFVEFPTIKEWNYYAKENGLLNSESIKYISGSNWHELRNRIFQNYKK